MAEEIHTVNLQTCVSKDVDDSRLLPRFLEGPAPAVDENDSICRHVA